MSDAVEDRASWHLVAPELRDALRAFPQVDSSLGVAGLRATLDAAFRQPIPEPLQAVACHEHAIAGLDGDPEVRLLVYSPPGEAGAARPVAIEIHGGGYITGSADRNEAANRKMAMEWGCTVVAVDYRLAPETPFPGAVRDCYAALEWVAESADSLGVDRNRIAIVGGSAGGGHAAALALYARDRGGPAICLQVLEAPMLDDRTGSRPDGHPHCGDFVWTAALNRLGWRSLLGVEPGSKQVPAGSVPARVDDLGGLPPAFISVGALDLFLEENLEFARRLSRAGVPVELHVIPGGYHGYQLSADAPQVQQIAQLRRNAVARAFGRS